jgi:hypothetical protein
MGDHQKCDCAQNITDSTEIVLFETILESLGIASNLSYVPAPLPLDLIKDKLNADGERPCQSALSNLCTPTSGLLNSHAGAYYCASKSRNLRQDDGVSFITTTPLNGKIDLVSSHGPLFLEIKGRSLPQKYTVITTLEFEILDQVLSRMFRLRGTYHQIKTAVGFAATSTIAWCFAFQMDDTFNKCSMKIWKIDHEDIFKIWSSVTAQFISDPIGWMLTTDAPIINKSLMSLGLHPSLCSVRIIRQSRSSHHRVYKVFLPRICSNLLGKLIGLPNETPDFCLKVHDESRTSGSFLRESAALSAMIADEVTTDFYAYGCLPNSSPIGQAQEISVTGEGRQIIATRSCEILESLSLRKIPVFDGYLRCTNVWSIFPDSTLGDDSGSSGVIIMQAGKCMDINHQNIAMVLDGVKKSISLAHAAGYCHCDIRASNILQFQSGCQLIDFDMANPIDTLLTFTEGAQFDNRGYLMQRAGLGEAVKWGISDDYQMLIELVQKATKEVENGTPPNSNSISAYARVDGLPNRKRRR